MRGTDVLQLALIGFLNQFLGDIGTAHKGLGQLLTIARQLLLELGIGIELHGFGLHHFHAESREQVEVFVNGFLLDDFVLEVVFGIDVGKFLHRDRFATNRHQDLLVEFRLG